MKKSKHVDLKMAVTFIFAFALLASGAFFEKAAADDAQELFSAINNRDNAALEAVLSRGVSTELRAPNNCTPLMFAAATNNFEAAKTLVEHGAIIDARGFTSQDGVANSTALILAAEMGAVEVAKLLIENGADVNYINSFNRTPLFWAYKANQAEMIKLLESKGATKEGKKSEDTKPPAPVKAAPAATGTNRANAAQVKANAGNAPAAKTPVKNATAAVTPVRNAAPAPKNPIVKSFGDAAEAARMRACCANMKVVEGGCELFLMDNGTPTEPLTVAGLLAKKYIKAEPKCALNANGSYIITMDGYMPVIKCPGHNKTLPEMIQAVDELKKAGK